MTECRSPTWSIPTPGPSRSGCARSSRTAEHAHDRPGHPPGARRQERRRGVDRHAQPLACPDDDLGLPGGQGRLRREAVQPQRPRGPDRRGGPPPVQRIVQHGTQSRSSQEWALAAAAIRSGKLGKLLVSRGALLQATRVASASSRTPRLRRKLDFNLWLGPAPEQPFHANLVHYNWHWFWDFGNGDIGNQGVHQMDIARWLIPGPTARPTYPKTVLSLGGRFGYHDQGQTRQHPDQRHGLRRHPAHLRGPGPEDRRIPRREGRQHRPPRGGDHRRGQVLPQGKRQGRAARPGSGITTEATRGPGKGHFGNFIAAVRSRKAEDLNADILKATTRPLSAISPTSRTGWDRRSPSTRRAGPSATTRTPPRRSPGWKSI